MAFPVVLKKQQVEFPQVNQKQQGISRGDQEKIMWNFQGPWAFSEGCNTILWSF